MIALEGKADTAGQMPDGRDKFAADFRRQNTCNREFQRDHGQPHDEIGLTIEGERRLKSAVLGKDIKKPGGHLVVTTINKTAVSYLLAIVAAEQVLGLVPQQTHTWEKFISPEQLESSLQAKGMRTMQRTGLFYNPMLPRWSIVPFTGVNYMMHFIKPSA